MTPTRPLAMKLQHPLVTGELRDWVDELIDVEKHFPFAAPNWIEGNRSGERRVHQWLLADGNGTYLPAYLSLTAYPTDRHLRFTITLNTSPPGWERAACIARLDFEPVYKAHTNRGHGAEIAGCDRVFGPNYHSWPNNRHLCGATKFPEQLDVAIPLAPTVRQFDQAMWWFCNEQHILLTSNRVPDWPTPTGQLL